MRQILALLVLLSVAGPVLAQTGETPTQRALRLREADLRAEQDLIRQHAVAVDTQLNTTDAQLRTDRNLLGSEAHNLNAMLPAPAISPTPLPPVVVDMSAYPTIPDAALAASRQRVLEASRNRR